MTGYDQVAASRELAIQIGGEALGVPVETISRLTGGNVAQVWHVVGEGQAVVVRLIHGIPGFFAADAALGRLLAGRAVPVPRLLGAGDRDGWDYVVSTFASGHAADRLEPTALRALLPELVRTLSEIHAIDVSGSTGFGSIGADCNGTSDSWSDAISGTFAVDGVGYWSDWRERLADSQFDLELFDRAYAAMLALLPHCPEHRWLVHGDFGFSNVLVEDGRIAAILDWSNARFGDFVWDIAWLIFFLNDQELRHILFQSLRFEEGSVPAFRDRLACYQLVIGMDSLRFYARAGDDAAYGWARERLEQLLVEL